MFVAGRSGKDWSIQVFYQRVGIGTRSADQETQAVCNVDGMWIMWWQVLIKVFLMHMVWLESKGDEMAVEIFFG